MSGYVVRPACGTRIKAGRAFCLKCFEPLPEEGAAAPTSAWESLGLSATQQAILIIVGGLVVVALVAVIWQTSSAPLDDQARPAAAPAAAAAAPTGAVAPASPPDVVGPRVAAFEPTSLAPAAAPKPESSASDVAALESFDQQLAQRPDDYEVLNRRGLALELLGRVSEAAACFERAVVLSPQTRSYHFNLARVYAALGQMDRAAAEYREVVRLRPDDYAARYTLALALQKKGDEEAAIPEFQKAVALGPDEPKAHLGLGVSLERVGRVSEAVPEYQRFIAMLPSSADAERLKEHLAALSRGLKHNEGRADRSGSNHMFVKPVASLPVLVAATLSPSCPCRACRCRRNRSPTSRRRKRSGGENRRAHRSTPTGSEAPSVRPAPPAQATPAGCGRAEWTPPPTRRQDGQASAAADKSPSRIRPTGPAPEDGREARPGRGVGGGDADPHQFADDRLVNRDDPIQKGKLERDRIEALADLADLKKAVEEDKKAIAQLHEDARLAGVPPGWLR